MARYKAFFDGPIEFVGRRFDSYGDMYFVPAANNVADSGLFVIRHPDHIRELLLAPSMRYQKTHSAFDRLSEVLGDGLLTLDGESWKRHRRMIQPAFHHRRMASYTRVMADEAERALARLTPDRPVDLGAEMVRLTLHVVSRALFGHEVGSDDDHVAHAMRVFHTVIGLTDLLPSWIPNPRRGRIERAVEELDRIIHGLIDDRLALLAAGASPPADLLQMLVSAVDDEGDGGKLSPREIRDELVTMFLAGHETTSHALTWTFYLLAQTPRVAERLHAEVDEVLAGRTPDLDDVDRLPYTQQVIKEAMRLYPPAYMLARKAHEDTAIGGFEVATGSEIVAWIYFTHRDARWFHHPNAFRPERFEPAREAELPKMAFLPFGGGPRACIGRLFAHIEATLVLATLAQYREFELATDRVVAVPRITLFPKDGLPVIARARGAALRRSVA